MHASSFPVALAISHSTTDRSLSIVFLFSLLSVFLDSNTHAPFSPWSKTLKSNNTFSRCSSSACVHVGVSQLSPNRDYSHQSYISFYCTYQAPFFIKGKKTTTLCHQLFIHDSILNHPATRNQLKFVFFFKLFPHFHFHIQILCVELYGKLLCEIKIKSTSWPRRTRFFPLIILGRIFFFYSRSAIHRSC